MSKPEPTLSFREIPPPDAAPQHPEATQYGILSCLRVEIDEDMFRCHQCGSMKEPGSPLVMVTDGIRIGDPVWSIEETSRRHAWNGHGSGWCIDCARKLGSGKPAPATEQPPRLASWWRDFWR